MRLPRTGRSARFLGVVIATLLLNACAAEPALPPGPEWKSGDIRRADDGTLQLAPARRPEAASPATAGSGARPESKVVTGTSIGLSWLPPTTYVDGRPIRGPLGYKVYYGHHFGRYTKTANAGGQTRLTIERLEPGKTYYFVVTAYTEEGTESSHSEAVAVRVVEP